MTTHIAVEDQLRRIGSNFRFWGRAECRELPQVLFPNETILYAINGRYENGFALLVATDERLLLIDKKPLFLCFEDMRYEMISEIDYIQQLLTAQLSLRTPGRNLRFTSFRPDKIRALTTYIQERVTEVRKHDVGIEDKPAQESPQPVWQPDSDYYRRQFEQLVTQMQAEAAESRQQNELTQLMPENHQFHEGRQLVGNPYSRIALSARRRVPKFSMPLTDNHDHFGVDDTTHVAQAH